MYPSSASSSSQGSMGSSGSGGGLMRYGSAPGSLLSTAVDSVVEATQTHLGHHCFLASEASESSAMDNQSDCKPRRSGCNFNRAEQSEANTTNGFQTSFGYGSGGGEGGGSSALFRHSSSPAGFLNQVTAAAGDRNGFSVTRGIGSTNSKGVAEGGGSVSRLHSQLSFTGKEALSRISEESEHQMALDNQKKSTHSYATSAGGTAPTFGMGSWPESQFQFSISQTAQEMASMEKLLGIPQDSVTCKIRAKRGCATHPRSIAERERRTRISGKLKKLQDLVPNMDKQTSYADMLDLAVHHIKCLQDQVQKLHDELENCTCGCKESRDS